MAPTEVAVDGSDRVALVSDVRELRDACGDGAAVTAIAGRRDRMTPCGVHGVIPLGNAAHSNIE